MHLPSVSHPNGGLPEWRIWHETRRFPAQIFWSDLLGSFRFMNPWLIPSPLAAMLANRVVIGAFKIEPKQLVESEVVAQLPRKVAQRGEDQGKRRSTVMVSRSH